MSPAKAMSKEQLRDERTDSRVLGLPKPEMFSERTWRQLISKHRCFFLHPPLKLSKAKLTYVF